MAPALEHFSEANRMPQARVLLVSYVHGFVIL